jgi:hypothetical protein
VDSSIPANFANPLCKGLRVLPLSWRLHLIDGADMPPCFAPWGPLEGSLDVCDVVYYDIGAPDD